MATTSRRELFTGAALGIGAAIGGGSLWAYLEPHVLDLKHAARAGMITSGDCTNCGRCTPICPEGSLGFDIRARIGPGKARLANS